MTFSRERRRRRKKKSWNPGHLSNIHHARSPCHAESLLLFWEAIVRECQSLCDMFMQILLCGVLILMNFATIPRPFAEEGQDSQLPSS